MEAVNARNTVLERENQGLRDASEASEAETSWDHCWEPWYACLFNRRLLGTGAGAEAATTARKGKGKEREMPVGSPGLLEDIRTVPGAMEWDLHDTVTLGDEY